MKITACKCDRCGKLYVPETLGGWSVHNEEIDRVTRTDDKYDLCPACQLGLKTWFEEGHEAA